MSKSNKPIDRIKVYLARQGIDERTLARLKDETKELAPLDKAKHLLKTYSIGKVVLILAVLIGGTIGVIFLVKVIRNVIGGMDIGGALNSALGSLNPMNAMGGMMDAMPNLDSVTKGGSGLLDGIKDWGATTFSKESMQNVFKENPFKDMKIEMPKSLSDLSKKDGGALSFITSAKPPSIKLPTPKISVPKPPKIKAPKIKAPKIKLPKW